MFSLLFFFSTTALILAQTPATAAASTADASAKKLNWDEKFEGVVHNADNIAGFVAYHSGKYPVADRDVFTQLDPDPARKLSRTKPYDTAAWEIRKVSTMRAVVWAKFSQNPELATKLLATGSRYLEETNWWGDKIWGVYRGEGQNLLGKIIMEARARLARASAAAPVRTK
jgi:predicted NAD-dependent protein-ADP-ribosyltransferase YbiA (DUF1768 family)